MQESNQLSENEEAGRYLSFFMANEEFAISLQSVKEVVALPPITPIPHSLPHCLGVMNLRGQVISIIDLRKKLNLKAENSAETTVILSDSGGVSIGYVVDSVNSVLVARKSDIADPPNSDKTKHMRFIYGVLKNKTNLVLLLNLQLLIDSGDPSAERKIPLRTA